MSYSLKIASVVFGMMGCLLMGEARADLNTIHHSDNEVWIAGGAELLNYKEPATSPNLPDSERGFAPTIGAGGRYLDDNNLYYALETNVAFGDIPYKGAFFFAPTVPLMGHTQERIDTIDAQFGMGLAVSSSVMLIPYIEGGFRSWHRDLSGVQQEDYSNFNVLGGLMLQFSPIDNWVLSLYASTGSTLSAQMKTAGSRYPLGNYLMFKGGGKLGYDVTENIEVFTDVNYDHFRYGQSPVVNAAYEPHSFTDEAQTRVGLAYHF